MGFWEKFRNLWGCSDTEEDLLPTESDYDRGYREGYKASLISAHADTIGHDSLDGIHIRTKIAQRLIDVDEERYKPHPNGMAVPTFMSIDSEDAFVVEWCFGHQGADDSYRIMFCWDPDEGAMTCKTTRNPLGQECYQNNDPEIGKKLKEWLYPMCKCGHSQADHLDRDGACDHGEGDDGCIGFEEE